MNDVPEQKLFRRLADALGESLEAVCNLNVQEREQLLLACGLKQEEENTEENGEDIQGPESPTMGVQLNFASGKRKRESLHSQGRKKRQSLLDLSEDDDAPLVPAKPEDNEIMIVKQIPAPTPPSKTTTTPGKNAHTPGNRAPTSVRKVLTPGKTARTPSTVPTPPPDDEDEAPPPPNPLPEIEELQLVEPTPGPSGSIRRRSTSTRKSVSPVEMPEERGVTPSVKDETIDSLLDFVVRHNRNGAIDDKERLKVWFTPCAPLSSSLPGCTKVNPDLVDQIPDLVQQLKNNEESLKSDLNIFNKTLKERGETFLEEEQMSTPLLERLNTFVSLPAKFCVEKEWFPLQIEDKSDEANLDALLTSEDEEETERLTSRSETRSATLRHNQSDNESDSPQENVSDNDDDWKTGKQKPKGRLVKRKGRETAKKYIL